MRLLGSDPGPKLFVHFGREAQPLHVFEDFGSDIWLGNQELIHFDSHKLNSDSVTDLLLDGHEAGRLRLKHLLDDTDLVTCILDSALDATDLIFGLLANGRLLRFDSILQLGDGVLEVLLVLGRRQVLQVLVLFFDSE